MNNEKYCLLIGNTRWHWAMKKGTQWSFFHTAPESQKLKSLNNVLWKWAAVGPIPSDIELDPSRLIKIEHIPLLNLPSWLGIDRALVGWGAYQKAKSKKLHSKGILIADAGTILSLTRITANGEFAGGQLVAGLKLQRLIMSEGTKNLSPVKRENIPKIKFPISTEEAMLQGSFQAILGTLLQAQQDANMPLWLCGGDGRICFDHLKNKNLEIFHFPDLAMEAMIKINLIPNQDLNQTKSDLP